MLQKNHQNFVIQPDFSRSHFICLCLLGFLLATLQPLWAETPGDWVTIATFNGNGIGRTESFKISAGAWRLAYTNQESPLIVSIQRISTNVVVETPLNLEGASGQSPVFSKTGEFSLEVESASPQWRIEIQNRQEKGQKINAEAPPTSTWKKIGEWAAAMGVLETKPFEIHGTKWRIHHEMEGDGMLQITVRDITNKNPRELVVNTDKPGTGESYMFRPGKYTLEITAVMANWKVQVEEVQVGTRAEPLKDKKTDAAPNKPEGKTK